MQVINFVRRGEWRKKGTTNPLIISVCAEKSVGTFIYNCQSRKDECYLIPIKSLRGFIFAIYVLTDSLRFGRCLKGIGFELSKCNTM